jgi:site-specific recombinase XerD
VSPGAELAPRDAGAPAPATVDGLGPAAHRAAEIMLRTRPSTRLSYQSVYRRFTAWLAEQTGQDNPGLEYFTADHVAGYLTHLENLGRAEATIRKDHAALNRLAKYLHAIRRVDATEILLIAGTPMNDDARTREALDEPTWRLVKKIAAARLIGDTKTRASRVTAARDHAMILLLGQAGLRSDELRALPRDPFTRKRSDSERAWLRVHGKRSKIREVPLEQDVVDALLRWEKARPPEVSGSPLLFPPLGRQRRDGSFPDALPHPAPNGSEQPRPALSAPALRDIVRPIMLAAGVPSELCHPHVLRHTYGTLFMRRGGALHELAELMGHTSIDTTRIYVHTSRQQLQAAVERNERRRGSPLLARDGDGSL